MAERPASVLILDIGSTTTKGLLFVRCTDRSAAPGDANGDYRLLASAQAATTVEAPDNDVRIGVSRVVSRLSGKTSTSPPYGSFLATSSAGGGLQILVIGYTDRVTTRSAEKAALNAGGLILQSLSASTGDLPHEWVEKLRGSGPDLILFTGGTDDGKPAFVAETAALVLFSRPQLRFEDTPVPIIYAGNKNAAEEVAGMLGALFPLTVVDNLRPSHNQERLGPARDAIHSVYLRHVMVSAPGYSTFLKELSAPIRPTPMAFGNMLQELAAGQSNLLAFDIGGATTDVFSMIDGQFTRTVSANLGMSYSLANVLKAGGVAAVKGWIPWLDDDIIAEGMVTKTMHPTWLPANETALAIERASARVALALACDQHSEAATTINAGHAAQTVQPFMSQETLLRQRLNIEEPLLDMALIDWIIGSGGVVSHADLHSAAGTIIDSFEPLGVTRLTLDRGFMLPHLGVWAEHDPSAALAAAHSECLVELGWCLTVEPSSHRRQVEPGARVGTIRCEWSGPDSPLESELVSGIVETFSPSSTEPCRVTIRLARGWELSGRGSGTIELTLPHGGEVGLLVDTRGRPLPGGSLATYLLGPEAGSRDPNTSAAPPSWQPRNGVEPDSSLEDNVVVSTRRIPLPEDADVAATAGQVVQPGDLLATVNSIPGQLRRVELSTAVAVPHERMETTLQAPVGTWVNDGDVLAATVEGGMWRERTSPWRGRVAMAVPPLGCVYIQERIDLKRGTEMTIDIPERLKMSRNNWERHLTLPDEDIERLVAGKVTPRRPIRLLRGQTIAGRWASSPERFLVMAPDYGCIVGSDHDGRLRFMTGFPEQDLRSNWQARVLDITPSELTLETQGWSFRGSYGIGREYRGTLCTVAQGVLTRELVDGLIPGERGRSVLLAETATVEALRALAANPGQAALILNHLAYAQLVAFLEEEPPIAITTGYESPLSLILLAGFGEGLGTAAASARLQQHNGRAVFMAPETQLRAGAKRPEVFLSQEGVVSHHDRFP